MGCGNCSPQSWPQVPNRRHAIALTDYLAVVRRRWPVVVLATAAGLAVAVVGVLTATKSYDATATLRVATGLSPGEAVQADSLEYTDRLMNTYKELAISRTVRRRVARRAGQPGAADVMVDIPPNTELMDITVRATDPELARRQADFAAEEVALQASQLADRSAESTAAAFRARLQEQEKELTTARAELERAEEQGTLDTKVAELEAQVALAEGAYTGLLEQSAIAQSAAITKSSTVSVQKRAERPTQPARPRKRLTIGLGLVLGFIGGLGLAFVWENLDKRLYTRDDVVEATNSVVLATVPRAPATPGLFDSNSPQEEAFARLRTNLIALGPEGTQRSILVTSAEPGAGKSTVTANLAASLARAGWRALAVDADLRRPQLHRLFNLSNDVGLSTLLVSGVFGGTPDIEEVVQEASTPGLSVLTSGPHVPDPGERLDSEEMANLMLEAVGRYDIVVVDTPALLSVSDGASLVPVADAVLLVVREGHSSGQAARDAREQLTAVRARNVGVVVNCSREARMPFFADYQRGVRS